MRKADRPLMIPFLCAFVFLAAAGALWFGAGRVERRETIRQLIPAIQADLVGLPEPVTLGSIEATVDRPLRLLAGAESRIDVTLSADAAAPDLKNLLMSEVIFVGAAVSDGTAFFPLEADLIQGSAHARIRAGSPASRPVGEWTLTELFFDSDGAEFDRWVRAARTFEIDVVRFMGLDAAWAMRLVWGLITAALGCCGWGVLRMIRLRGEKKNER